VSFAAITLYATSQRVFIVVSVYFVTDSVRKLLDTPSFLYTPMDKGDRMVVMSRTYTEGRVRVLVCSRVSFPKVLNRF
jgi:hypothetical protein